MQTLSRDQFDSVEEFREACEKARAAAMSGETFTPQPRKSSAAATVVIPDTKRPGRPCVYHLTSKGEPGTHTTRAAIRACAEAHGYKAFYMKDYVA